MHTFFEDFHQFKREMWATHYAHQPHMIAHYEERYGAVPDGLIDTKVYARRRSKSRGRKKPKPSANPSATLTKTDISNILFGDETTLCEVFEDCEKRLVEYVNVLRLRPGYKNDWWIVVLQQILNRDYNFTVDQLIYMRRNMMCMKEGCCPVLLRLFRKEMTVEEYLNNPRHISYTATTCIKYKNTES